MNRRNLTIVGAAVALTLMGSLTIAGSKSVSDDVIKSQRDNLATSTNGAGFGPQSPRDIDSIAGTNTRVFQAAPAHTEMNLCNIHMHEGAEHKGGDFTAYNGNGDGKGYGTGFKYSGELSAAELSDDGLDVGKNSHCLLYTSPSPRDATLSRMPSSA